MSEEEDASQELLEQLKKIDGECEQDRFKDRFSKAWKSLKLKSAIGHVGLLVSLSIYCAVGGIVSVYRSIRIRKMMRWGGFETDIKVRDDRRTINYTENDNGLDIKSWYKTKIQTKNVIQFITILMGDDVRWFYDFMIPYRSLCQETYKLISYTNNEIKLVFRIGITSLTNNELKNLPDNSLRTLIFNLLGK